MRPMQVLGELPKERRGGAGAPLAAADVRDIGEIAFQLFHVFLADRHRPRPIVGTVAGRREFIRQGAVVAHQAAEMIAERDDAGTRQGRDIDDRRRLEAAAVGERVAQHQATFGVRVENFHRLTRHGRHDVGRFDGAAARHVLRGRDDHDEVDGQSQFGNGAHRTQDRGRAAHVELHFRPSRR